MQMRYKSRGWFREPYRHSLAAKGIKTKHSYALFNKDPNAKPMEAFKSPEEKSDIGKGMIDRIVDNKMMQVEDNMQRMDVSFEDKRRVMDHHVYPIVQRFKNGNISEEQFNQEVDTKVQHNLGAYQKSAGVFNWGKSDEIDKSGNGTFNFIGRAQNSKSFAGKSFVFKTKDPDAKPSISTVDGEARYFGTEVENENGKWNDNYAIKDGYWVIHEGNKHHIYKVDVKRSMAGKDLRTKKLTMGDRIFGFGVIGSAMTIEKMKEDETYVNKKTF